MIDNPFSRPEPFQGRGNQTKDWTYHFEDPTFVSFYEQLGSDPIRTEASLNKAVTGWRDASIREKIFWLSARGKTSEEIGGELRINPRTVRRTLSRPGKRKL